MVGEQRQHSRGQRDGAPTSAGLDVIEDETATLAVGTPACMVGALRRTRWRAGPLVSATVFLAGFRLVVLGAALVGSSQPCCQVRRCKALRTLSVPAVRST